MAKFTLTASILLLSFFSVVGQSFESLRGELSKVIESKHALVGLDILGIEPGDTLSFNGHARLPMQSVFKFHIAIAILAEVDKKKLSLDQRITIRKNELLPGLYSPLREKYPNGTRLTLRDILQYCVSQSDNVACDVLLKLAGGPLAVERYFHRHGFTDLSIKINEQTMQGNWDMQFENWTTPREATAVLKAFYENDQKFLSQQSHEVLWAMMKQTVTGSKRIRGELPTETVVAHKTGWSGTNQHGVTAACNNIGIVFLPDGGHFYLSVFVSNSTEAHETNEGIIASIAKIVWDYYVTSDRQ